MGNSVCSACSKPDEDNSLIIPQNNGSRRVSLKIIGSRRASEKCAYAAKTGLKKNSFRKL